MTLDDLERLQTRICVVELQTHTLGGGAVARNPCIISWAFLLLNVNHVNNVIVTKLHKPAKRKAMNPKIGLQNMQTMDAMMMCVTNDWA